MNSLHHTLRASGAKIISALLLTVAALAAGGPVLAQPLPGQPALKLDFPTQSPGVPAYARLELIIPGFDVPKNDHWAAIVFYRDPACIPSDFDLGQFFHFPGPHGLGAFACELLVQGHEIWENGPMEDLAPLYVYSGAMSPNLPVWFVARAEIEALFASGAVYIDQLENLPSLLRGRAWWFEELNRPNGGAPDPALSLRARGRLEDGAQFSLEWHFHPSAGEDIVTIDIGTLPPASPPRPRDIKCLIHPYLPSC